jgi:PAS domain-containing protein
LAAGKPFEKEARLLRADGQYRWFVIRAVPLRDEEGNIVNWYGTSIDIEDLKRAEDRVRLSIDTIPTMAWTVRSDGAVDFVNRRWLDYTGLTLEEEVADAPNSSRRSSKRRGKVARGHGRWGIVRG